MCVYDCTCPVWVLPDKADLIWCVIISREREQGCRQEKGRWHKSCEDNKWEKREGVKQMLKESSDGQRQMEKSEAWGGRDGWGNQERYDMKVGKADREKGWASREVERQAAMCWPCSEPAVWSLIPTLTHDPTVSFLTYYTSVLDLQHVNKSFHFVMLSHSTFMLRSLH